MAQTASLAAYGYWSGMDVTSRADRLHQFRSLMLYGRDVTDNTIAMLEACSGLKELHIVNSSITDEALRTLGRLRSLDWLVLDSADISDEGISHLSSLDNLNGIQLVKTKVGDEGMPTLFHFPRLHYLEVAGSGVGGRSLSCITQLSSLQILRVASPTANDVDFINFAFAKSLQSLSFDMPLVTGAAIEEVTSRVTGCQFFRYRHYQPSESLIHLVRHFVDDRAFDEYARALEVANEAICSSPSNPALLGARAIINYRMGNLEDFKGDMTRILDYRTTEIDREIVKAVSNFRDCKDPYTIRKVMESIQPERLIAEKLLSGDVGRLHARQAIKRFPSKAERKKALDCTADPLVVLSILKARDEERARVTREFYEARSRIDPNTELGRRASLELSIMEKLRKSTDPEQPKIILPWEW